MMIFQRYKNLHTHLLGVILLNLLVLCGCSDDLLNQGLSNGQVWQGDGRKVNMVLSFQFPQPDKYSNTRAVLDEQAESFVNDLYVVFFPINADNKVGNAALHQYFTYDELHKLEDKTDDGHFNRGWVSVQGVPTGTYYIVGFANVQYGMHQGFLDDLEAATTWDEFQHLQVRLRQEEGQEVNLDRTRLCMSGYFHDPTYVDGSTDHPAQAVVTQSGEIGGYIHLRRLDAKIKFIIRNEIPNCTNFSLTGWKMCKVPSSSSLMEQDTDAAGIDYQNTNFRQYWTFMPKKAGITDEKDHDKYDHYDFAFYMFENRKPALTPAGQPSLTTYKQREQENKQADGHNDRDSQGNRVYHYVYAHEDAPYLVFEANMEQTMPGANGTTYPRTAQMQYVVHLGYCEPKGGTEAERAKDFNTRRNSEYTYVIHIRGVNEIVVEAQQSTTDDYMHGVEGTVVDMVGGQIEQLDTHYGVFNVTLTRAEIRDMLLDISSAVSSQKMVLSDNQSLLSHTYADYLANPSSITPNINYMSEDYQAFRIAPLAGDVNTDLVSYSQTYDYDCETGIPAKSTLLPPHAEKKQRRDGNHTIPVYDLIGLKLTYGKQQSASNPNGWTDANQNDPLNFTVFINEYYYYYNNGVIPNSRTLDANGNINTSTEGNTVEQERAMWKQIANVRSHRYFRLYADTSTSTDDDSHYVTGKLVVEQRAPQTYYSGMVDVAVALEHINEHHWKLIEGAGSNGSHGWAKTYNQLNGQSWGNQSTKLGEGYPAFMTRNNGSGNSNYAARHGTSTNTNNHTDKWTGRNGAYVPAGSHDTRKYNILDAALSRNRDLDRNNTISSAELRWYTPFENQYVDFAVGQGALETPLFSREDASPVLLGDEQVYSNRRFHFMGSNDKHVWSEEGTSVGSGVYGWEIRCCRIMGTEDYASNLHLAVPYEFDSQTRMFDTRRFAETGIHRGYALSEAMLPHDNLDLQSNALPYYFKMAKVDSPLKDVIPASEAGFNTKQEVLWNRMITDAYCRDYSEDPEGRDLGKWHVPNQMELALMFYGAGLRPSGGQFLSSTYWWRNENQSYKEGSVANQTNNWRHYMGANGSNLRMLHTGQDLGSSALIVRCVIDVDKDGNPAGTPEYGNVVKFQPGTFTANYSGDKVNMQVGASIENGVFQSVTIDGITATSTSGLSITSSVSNAPVTKSVVTVNWKIKDTNTNKILSFSKEYQLPARYWMISRYGATNRYAMVNLDNNQTAVGATDNRNVDDIEAIYKWVITTNSSSTTNVSDLQIGTTYYLYNAGAKAYISNVASSRGYMGVGGTAVQFQLQKRSGYDGYYVLRFNNSTHANSNGGVQNFGTWDGGPDDGCTYLLTPVVMRGEMPLSFTWSDMSKSGGNISFPVTMTNTAIVQSVTVNGVTASISGNAGNYTATVPESAVSGALVYSVQWKVSYEGQNVTRSKDFSGYKAKLLTWSDINNMTEGSQKTVVWGNPSSTKSVFASHNGTSASWPSYGFNNAQTLLAAANSCVLNINHHFILTKVSGGYTLTSKNGGFSPNKNGGNVSWSATPQVLTLENYTGGSTSAIVDWQPASSIRIKRDNTWINVNGPVYNTGAGDWVKMYFYEVVDNID